MLAGLPDAIILSDPETSTFLTSHTAHNVIYGVYLQYELLTSRDLAERYCLTLVPVSTAEHSYPTPHIFNYTQQRDPLVQEDLKQQEEVMLAEACARVEADPAGFLKRYGVEYIFWDEKRQPDWDLRRTDAPVHEYKRGEGWSLWQLQLSGTK